MMHNGFTLLNIFPMPLVELSSLSNLCEMMIMSTRSLPTSRNMVSLPWLSFTRRYSKIN